LKNYAGINSMLSDSALDVAQRLRARLGPNVEGVGPDNGQLVEMFSDYDPDDLVSALDELKRFGFLKVEIGRGAERPDEPRPLRNIVSVNIMEPLQKYFDRLEG